MFRFLQVKTKPILFLLIAALFFAVFSSCNKRSGKPRLLVFSKTAAFHHESIPVGNDALLKLAAENGYDVDTTTDASWFNHDSLDRYAAVIFLHTTGDVLNHHQEVAFERYIQAGGGYVGIHAAADTEYDWGWYGRLVGGYFESHPAPQEATLHVVDVGHPATESLPASFSFHDEWYNFKKLSPDINVLITIDEGTYEGGRNGAVHPIAWYHDYDGGRAFYTGMGHTDEAFQDSLFLRHILGGIQYAAGDNRKLNYRRAKSLPVPESQRFTKTQLQFGGLFEPTEMAILPNFDILVAQRRGELMRFSPEAQTLKQVGFLEVYHRTEVPNVNAEEGFMGLALDPDFEQNNYLYAFYSPTDTSVNRLSRFVYANDTLDRSSEKIILQFYSQRDICCHTGGSIAFDSDGLLYLSTGDNTTPFDQPNQRFQNRGFAPLDGRPGWEQYDARRSSGNSNDLRGKILRIDVASDGDYRIPAGNLFAEGQEKTRPEIYVMGNRNPYRISIDPKTNFLYWGEVGPDANNDSLATRGPRGYDEVNQAREAGFFGWPLFVGNNYPYREYDYTTGQSGRAFDPERPENNSPNNTGLQLLPPAQPAFIWYPYAASPDFPQVGTGGRNAMAGPVYYEDLFPRETRYPTYYDGKLFIYDWIRGWIRAVTLLPNGDFDKMEPFMEGVKFNNPIDMEVGKDGRLYVLEYGSGWFSQNEDAGIARIDYTAGNLPPQVGDIELEQTNGEVPFTVQATVTATDYENDALTYTWKIGEVTQRTKEPVLTYTLDQVGEYEISVTVEDPSKGKSESNPATVYAGNANPVVAIVLTNTSGHYAPGEAIGYEVTVDDGERPIDLSNLVVSVDYIKGSDLASAALGHQQVSELVMGRSLMMASDCRSCHQLAEPSVGPSYMQVASRYKGRDDASSYLVGKIRDGGSGVWGEVAMAAHPEMKESEARQIVQWIMSLAEDQTKRTSSLPAKGTIVAQPPAGHDEQTILRITAEYTNAPEIGIRPLSGAKTIDLKLRE